MRRRMKRGKVGACKLSDEEATALRREYAAGGTTERALATKYELSHAAVHNLLVRNSYRWTA